MVTMQLEKWRYDVHRVHFAWTVVNVGQGSVLGLGLVRALVPCD